MDKRQPRSSLARKRVQSSRVLQKQLTRTDSPEPKKRKKNAPKEKRRKNPITKPLVPIPPAFIAEKQTKTSPPFFSSYLSLTSLSQKITISNILTIISKSISGLRLRQNTILLEQISPEFQSYASAISRSSLLADKLLAFRSSGPSFNAIKDALNIPHPSIRVTSGTEANKALKFNELFLTRWIIMRLFGFGHPDLITSLGTIKAPKDVLNARKAYHTSTGAGVNSISAYGNLRFDPKRVPGYVCQIFEGGKTLFSAMTVAREKGGGIVQFQEVLRLIGEASIPYYSSGSLLQWLLACDLAELDGIVVPPVAGDLAARIGCYMKERKGGSGAWNGLVKGIEQEDWPELTVGKLTDYLEGIYHGVKEGLGTQGVCFRERGFWYSDLEHCLCKVVRAGKY